MHHFNISYGGLYSKAMAGWVIFIRPRLNTPQLVGAKRRFPHSVRERGELRQGRYKAFLIDADNDPLEVSRYIHLNPTRIWTMDWGLLGKRVLFNWVKDKDLTPFLAFLCTRTSMRLKNLGDIECLIVNSKFRFC